MKVDVPYPLFFSIRLALWTRDRAEMRAGPSISITRSKHSVFIEQTKLDVANPFSFSSVVRIDEGNKENEGSHLTLPMLGPAMCCPLASYKPEENQGLGKLTRIPRFSSMKVDVPYHLFFAIKLALWTRDHQY